ncbi:nitroreductase family protein, partial [Kribbella albertanoniae]
MTETLGLTPDELLTTTRTVRKRLDLSRPVPIEVVRECIEVAVQAPSGSNRQTWHWMVVTDAAKRAAIGEYYRL